MITKAKIDVKKVIHIGDKTHNQGQLITSVSFRIEKIIARTQGKLIEPLET